MTQPQSETVPVQGAPVDPPSPEAEADQPGLIEQLHGLYADGRAMVDAEVSFQKVRLAAAGRQIRAMALLAFVGLVLIVCALIALVVGTMIALVPLIGGWGAMGATVLGSLLLAVLTFWLAARRIGKISALFASDTNDDEEAKAGA
ncbi:phage holin family protein [Blastomonas sp. SL216]|uniref:phage holin family protein n=1 Tax=Blastomonas sp. SL216 TaxID=2995169 RepID=UPI0023774F6A|nr:phage holin family protein [Blastomonas sp. SL216]